VKDIKMTKFSRLAALGVVLFACVFAITPLMVNASGMHQKVMVEDAWARASKGKVAGAFMTVQSHSDADDVLLSAASDAAKRVEIHRMETVDGIMKMIHMHGGVTVPAKGTLTLKPGSYHVMLMGLKAPLIEGETFNIRLTFKHAGEIDTVVTVNAAGAMESMKNDHGHTDHDMKKKAHKHSD
jgi:copper(I)-binding protein